MAPGVADGPGAFTDTNKSLKSAREVAAVPNERQTAATRKVRVFLRFFFIGSVGFLPR